MIASTDGQILWYKIYIRNKFICKEKEEDY
jgi:hypothetical protein